MVIFNSYVSLPEGKLSFSCHGKRWYPPYYMLIIITKSTSSDWETSINIVSREHILHVHTCAMAMFDCQYEETSFLFVFISWLKPPYFWLVNQCGIINSWLIIEATVNSYDIYIYICWRIYDVIPSWLISRNDSLLLLLGDGHQSSSTDFSYTRQKKGPDSSHCLLPLLINPNDH